METANVTLTDLTWAIGAAVPTLDRQEQEIAVGIYRLLARGEPVSPDEIARVAGVDRARVDEALGAWPGVYRDDDGDVIGFWGLAIAPLDPEYRIRVDGRTLYAWCAWDNLFIPAILGTSARVEATTAVAGEPVTMIVDPSGARAVEPTGAVVSMVIPDGPFGFDVIESFCHRVLFFGSREEADRWVSEHPGTTLLSVEDAFELGRRHIANVFPDVFNDHR